MATPARVARVSGTGRSENHYEMSVTLHFNRKGVLKITLPKSTKAQENVRKIEAKGEKFIGRYLLAVNVFDNTDD